MWKRISHRLFSEISNKPREIKFTKRFTQNDLNAFTKLTNDYNTIHSENGPPERRFVHGAFLNAVVAGIMGTQLPGPGTVVVEQNFKFPKPCRIEVDTEFTVRLLNNRKILLVEYEGRQGNETVFQGNAKLLYKEVK